jgi:hypothetical protein
MFRHDSAAVGLTIGSFFQWRLTEGFLLKRLTESTFAMQKCESD